jgi:hypothetical protein
MQFLGSFKGQVIKKRCRTSLSFSGIYEGLISLFWFSEYAEHFYGQPYHDKQGGNGDACCAVHFLGIKHVRVAAFSQVVFLSFQLQFSAQDN